jgi:hypothetical protein
MCLGPDGKASQNPDGTLNKGCDVMEESPQQTVITYLDSYCERAGDASLWAEPINAATNLFFLLAAFAAVWHMARLRDPRFASNPDIWLLILALTGIALGSGLWHIFATHETMLMDVLPITAFINIYLIAALRRFFSLAWWKVAVLWALYTGVGVAAQVMLPADTLNGTIMYIPTYATLIALTGALWQRHRPVGIVFANVLAVWTASLVFRTVDLEICEQFPIGTHFLWHSLNAWVLYRLLLELIRKAK